MENNKVLETIVGILGTAFLLVVGWTIQLGNRVSVTETKQMDLETLINTRFDAVDDRLDRIERSLNGYLKGK